MPEFRKELRYAPTHEWARLEGELVRVGITDFAQSELSDIVFVELPKVGQELARGREMGVVESVKSASDLYAPISGRVVEVNAALAKTPELINTSPYEKGWLVLIKPSDPSELGSLLDAEAYERATKEAKH
ncbi:MAG: glycine cleavage system protein GcvH [Thermoplasmatota archaeon]